MLWQTVLPTIASTESHYEAFGCEKLHVCTEFIQFIVQCRLTVLIVENFVSVHSCETCNKGFSSITSLKHHMDNRHMPNHMKPFKCSLCNKGFMSDPKLARHISIIHCTEESKKFECNECGKK